MILTIIGGFVSIGVAFWISKLWQDKEYWLAPIKVLVVLSIGFTVFLIINIYAADVANGTTSIFLDHKKVNSIATTFGSLLSAGTILFLLFEKKEATKKSDKKEMIEQLHLQMENIKIIKTQIVSRATGYKVTGILNFRDFLLDYQYTYKALHAAKTKNMTREQVIKLAWYIFYYGINHNLTSNYINDCYLGTPFEEVYNTKKSELKGCEQYKKDEKSGYVKVSDYGHQSFLGYYFRNIYQTYKLLEKMTKSKLFEDDLQFYRVSFKNIFNDNELALITLNSFCYLDVEKSVKLIEYVTNNSLIENLGLFFIDEIDHRFLFPGIRYEGEEVPFKETKRFQSNDYLTVSDYNLRHS
ncbi:MAG: putative phage abortive infection protein [Carboxylicivirga sp.]|jgi:hypothetical protein|nr:putative phage abortive infection protein [Carboxylicivirga sp.]